jgi:hypothetical protein
LLFSGWVDHLVHSAGSPGSARIGRSQTGGAAMVTVGLTDIASEIERNASAGPRTIFTGMRCTTLTKLLVVFPGGYKANSDARTALKAVDLSIDLFIRRVASRNTDRMFK